VISGDQFAQALAEMCESGPPSDSWDLVGMSIDCMFYLGDPAFADDEPDLWRGMTVKRPKNSPWLITGRAVGRRSDASQIVAALSQIWEGKLRYRYRNAHVVSTSADSVVLQGVTQIGENEFWVTVNIEVTLI
jgi:hypothetical protein